MKIKNNLSIDPVFALILLSFAPFYVSFNIINDSEYLTLLVGASYIAQITAIMYMCKGVRVAYNKVIVISLYCASIIISAVMQYLFKGGLGGTDLVGTIIKVINCILYMGLLSSLKYDRDKICRLLANVVVMCVVACVINIIYNYDTILQLNVVQNSYQVDLRSIFPNRNQFGAFIFLSFVALLYISLYRPMRVSGSLVISLLLLLLVNLLLTMSRGAIVATLILGVASLVIYFNRTQRLIYVLIFVFVGVAIYINDALRMFVSNIIIRQDVGTTGREYIWELGIKVFLQNPVFGMGYFDGLEVAQQEGLTKSQFHNMYIDTLVSGGAIEIVALIGILGYVLYSVKKSGLSHVQKVGVYASFIAMFVLGIVESVSYFSIGFVDTVYTVFFVSLPLMLINTKINMHDSGGAH